MQVKGDKSVFSALDEWPHFLQKAAMALGGLLLASAGICWIAANWDQATALQKLAGTQLVLVVLVLTACHLNWRPRAAGAQADTVPTKRRPAAALALGLAAVTTGALLALVGQIYQTGADPWQLFGLWLALILPWVVVSPGVFLALLGAALLNLSAALYLDIPGSGPLRIPLGEAPALGSVLMLGVNLILLLAWEHLRATLGDRWRIGPRVLLLAVTFWLFSAQLEVIDGPTGPWLIALLGWVLAAVAIHVYTKRAWDLAMVTLAALTAFGLFAVALLTSIESEGALIGVVLVLMLLAGWTMHLLLRLWRSDPHKLALQPATAPSSTESLPWFISLFRLATMAFIAALLVLFVFIVLNVGTESAWFVGLVFSLSGLGLMRLPSARTAQEAALVLTTAGIFMTVGGAFALYDLDHARAIVLLSAYGLVVYAVSTHATLRFLCALVVLSAILILSWPQGQYWDVLDSKVDLAHAVLAYSRLWWLTIAAVLAWALAQRAPYGSPYRSLMPLAWALSFLAQLAAWMAPAPAFFGALQVAAHEPGLFLLWIACAALPVCALAALLWRAPRVSKRLKVAAPAVLAVASVGWMGAAGVSLALLWLVLAYAYRQTALLAFAVLSMLAYLSRFYYLLESTLLEKSVVLALTGAWLLVSCMVSRSLGQGGRQPHGHAAAAHAVEPGAVTANAPHTLRNQRRPGGLHQSAGLLAGLAVILAVVNLGIYQRDQILKHGESVILALAPVDPRSLMQGDYMALRFQVADEIRAALANPASPLVEAIKAQRGGFLILQRDAQGVSHLQSVSPGAELAGAAAPQPGQSVLEFRLRGTEPFIVTDAWFFPEGQAQRYEAARYGEIRVGDHGTGLLRGLLDRNLQPLGPGS